VRCQHAKVKTCAELLTSRGLRIVSTCPRVGKMSTFRADSEHFDAYPAHSDEVGRGFRAKAAARSD